MITDSTAAGSASRVHRDAVLTVVVGRALAHQAHCAVATDRDVVEDGVHIRAHQSIAAEQQRIDVHVDCGLQISPLDHNLQLASAASATDSSEVLAPSLGTG
jgi:hypothetical protein